VRLTPLVLLPAFMPLRTSGIRRSWQAPLAAVGTLVASYAPHVLIAGALVLFGSLLLVSTPSYPWYCLPLVVLAVLARRLEWLAVPVAAQVEYARRARPAAQNSRVRRGGGRGHRRRDLSSPPHGQAERGGGQTAQGRSRRTAVSAPRISARPLSRPIRE